LQTKRLCVNICVLTEQKTLSSLFSVTHIDHGRWRKRVAFLHMRNTDALTVRKTANSVKTAFQEVVKTVKFSVICDQMGHN